MASSFDPATAGAQIESLVRTLDALDETAGRAQARELVRLLMSLYGAAFARMLDVIRTERAGGDAVLHRFAEDGLIASLLVLHELHPYSAEARVTRAIELLQPHLPPPTRAEIIAVAADRVAVRVLPPAGRSASAGIRSAIERAIQEAAPEIGTIDIEGLQEGDAPLIQIQRAADVLGARDAS